MKVSADFHAGLSLIEGSSGCWEGPQKLLFLSEGRWVMVPSGWKPEAAGRRLPGWLFTPRRWDKELFVEAELGVSALSSHL